MEIHADFPWILFEPLAEISDLLSTKAFGVHRMLTKA